MECLVYGWPVSTQQTRAAPRLNGRLCSRRGGLIDELPGGVDRDREADPLGALRDGAVDAHHLATLVDERPAAVARVDRGGGLDEAGQLLGGAGHLIANGDRAVERRDD